MKTRQIIISIILGFSILFTVYNPALSRPLPIGPHAPLDEFVITAVYPSFDSNNIRAFQLNGHATLVGDRLQLTEPIGLQTGTAWWQNRITLLDERSFSAYFTFEISQPGNGGADGLVFAIQTQSSGAGTVGGGMGYGGIPNSVGIEFDTYSNDTVDPDGNHLGLNLNGSMTSLKTANPPGNLESGTWYVWVDYDGLSDSLEVRMDNTNTRPISTVLTDTIDLAVAFDPDVFVGFTAATGGSYERHQVLTFYFHNDYLPGGIIPETHTYLQAPEQVIVAANPQMIPADGSTTSTISATVLDVLGAPLEGFSISFDTDLGAINPLTAVSGPDGVATAHLSSSTTGTANVRVTAVGGAFDEVDVVVEPYIPTPTQVTISAAPGNIPADGIGASVITATVRDFLGDPMPGVNVVFSTDLGIVNPSNALTNQDGMAIAALSSNQPGTATVRVTAEGGLFEETTVEVEVIYLKLFLPIILR